MTQTTRATPMQYLVFAFLAIATAVTLFALVLLPAQKTDDTAGVACRPIYIYSWQGTVVQVIPWRIPYPCYPY
jgi:hypothetical protein